MPIRKPAAVSLDYPILLRLEGRLCVVVGGGEVAARKVDGLLECGARVRVIAPEVVSRLGALASKGRIEHLARRYRRGDLRDAFLVIGATNDSVVNHRLYEDAERRHILVNVVDQPELCTCTMPARIRRGRVTIAISTGGGAPALAKHLRTILEETIGPEYGILAELMASLRAEVMRRFATEAQRRAVWEAILSSEVPALLRTDKNKEAKARARACLSSLSV